MATYEKRSGNWRVKVHRKGRRATATFPTKRQAEEWAAKVEGEAISTHYRMPLRKTLGDAITEYRSKVAPRKPGARWEDLRLSSFAERETQLCARQLASLTEADFAAWRDRRVGEVSASTVRREFALLGAVLGIARREWRWLSHDPLKIKKPKEPPARRRGVGAEEILAIVIHAPHEVACALLLGIETGMRAGEILGLTWGHVDLERRVVTLPKTKNGDSRQVPLSIAASALLQECKASAPAALPKQATVEVGGNSALATLRPVFTITWSTFDFKFRAARARAVPFCPSIATLRFHDTRSEAISRLSKRLDVLDLARVVGHRSINSLLFYYKSSAEDLAKKLG